MKHLTLNQVRKNNDTCVSNIFLDTYMRDANGEFVKVYLYLLRCADIPDAGVTVSDIADRLNLTEKDVVRALKYWVSVKVLDVVFDEDTDEASSITFLPLESVTAQDFRSSDDTGHDSHSSVDTAQNSAPVRTSGSAHSYSPAKIRRMKEQEDVKQLLYIVEKYIGKPLTSTEMGTVLYIHEELGFSSELTEYLVEYCVTNNHRSLRYIEAVALAWHEKGITSVAEAREKSALRSNRTYIVSNTFGIGDRNITPVEMEFINRWYDEYGFDSDMVSEACRRTVISMGKPNFSYADGILKKWRSAGVHTPVDLKKLDAGFRAKITIPVSSGNAQPPAVNNRFNNFSQRTYNFEELEKKLINN